MSGINTRPFVEQYAQEAMNGHHGTHDDLGARLIQIPNTGTFENFCCEHIMGSVFSH